MSEIRDVSLDRIFPPENVQRTDYDEEAMVELCNSIERLGLLQPVGVTPLEDGMYRLVWGMRRYLAHQRMGRQTIAARLVSSTEQELDDMIMHENLHREAVNPLDEAAWMSRYMEQYAISQDEMARRAKCSVSRVASLLSLLRGDAEVSAALRAGTISKAQALVINRIRDPAGRAQGLQWACKQGMSAAVIQTWADHREQSGVADAVATVDYENIARVFQETKNQAKCVLHDGWVEYNQALWLTVCVTCWDAAQRAIAWAQQADEDWKKDTQQEGNND